MARRTCACILLVFFAELTTASLLQCGEQIVVKRGEKKTIKFWSSENRLLTAEVVPERNKINVTSLFSMFRKTSQHLSLTHLPKNNQHVNKVKTSEQESLKKYDKNKIYNRGTYINNSYKENKEPPPSIFRTELIEEDLEDYDDPNYFSSSSTTESNLINHHNNHTKTESRKPPPNFLRTELIEEDLEEYEDSNFSNSLKLQPTLKSTVIPTLTTFQRVINNEENMQATTTFKTEVISEKLNKPVAIINPSVFGDTDNIMGKIQSLIFNHKNNGTKMSTVNSNLTQTKKEESIIQPPTLKIIQTTETPKTLPAKSFTNDVEEFVTESFEQTALSQNKPENFSEKLDDINIINKLKKDYSKIKPKNEKLISENSTSTRYTTSKTLFEEKDVEDNYSTEKISLLSEYDINNSYNFFSTEHTPDIEENTVIYDHEINYTLDNTLRSNVNEFGTNFLIPDIDSLNKNDFEENVISTTIQASTNEENIESTTSKFVPNFENEEIAKFKNEKIKFVTPQKIYGEQSTAVPETITTFKHSNEFHETSVVPTFEQATEISKKHTETRELDKIPRNKAATALAGVTVIPENNIVITSKQTSVIPESRTVSLFEQTTKLPENFTLSTLQTLTEQTSETPGSNTIVGDSVKNFMLNAKPMDVKKESTPATFLHSTIEPNIGPTVQNYNMTQITLKPTELTEDIKTNLMSQLSLGNRSHQFYNEIPLQRSELHKIISELRNQEVSLKKSVKSEGPSGALIDDNEENQASLKVKLKLIENIIKEVASEIANHSNSENVNNDKTENKVNVQSTTVSIDVSAKSEGMPESRTEIKNILSFRKPLPMPNKSNVEEIFIPIRFLDKTTSKRKGPPGYIHRNKPLDTVTNIDKNIAEEDNHESYIVKDTRRTGVPDNKKSKPLSNSKILNLGFIGNNVLQKRRQELEVIKENSLFGENSGNNNIVNLLRKNVLSKYHPKTERVRNEQNLFLNNVRNKLPMDSGFIRKNYRKPDSQVHIQEHGSRVVVIKPYKHKKKNRISENENKHSDILKPTLNEKLLGNESITLESANTLHRSPIGYVPVGLKSSIIDRQEDGHFPVQAALIEENKDKSKIIHEDTNKLQKTFEKSEAKEIKSENNIADTTQSFGSSIAKEVNKVLNKFVDTFSNPTAKSTTDSSQTLEALSDHHEPSFNLNNKHSYERQPDISDEEYEPKSPIYINLPGESDAVPVYLQTEPVEVHNANSNVKPASNMTSKNKLRKKYILKTPLPYAGHSETEEKPDPFFVMDPPNLFDNISMKVENFENNEASDFLPSKEDNTITIELKGNYNFSSKSEEKNVPNIVKGKNPIYPGEYFIKNPDNSYSSSDTNGLTNPVFSLGSKATLPSPAPAVPQYTPFPLTTNPPRKTTSLALTTKASQVNYLPLLSQVEENTIPLVIKSTAPKITFSEGNPPSMDFSPAPFIEYQNSYVNENMTNMPADIPHSNIIEIEPYDATLNEIDSDAYEHPKQKENLSSSKTKIPPKEDEFDIVVLANFLHQNQKVWSNPSETKSKNTPTWDKFKYSNGNDGSGATYGVSPWLLPEEGVGGERYYSAFYSPEEIPGLDPTKFSYRKMPNFGNKVKRSIDPTIEGIKRFMGSLPSDVRSSVMGKSISNRQKRFAERPEHIYCEWNIKTDLGLYMLVTFHNLSAPYTVDCFGAYIEVERENNGYDARWCGNRALEPGLRSHVIFVKSEVRITVYDDGEPNKQHPTGFEADVEVIDLFDTDDYETFIEKKATPRIRRLMKG